MIHSCFIWKLKLDKQFAAYIYVYSLRKNPLLFENWVKIFGSSGGLILVGFQVFTKLLFPIPSQEDKGEKNPWDKGSLTK